MNCFLLSLGYKGKYPRRLFVLAMLLCVALFSSFSSFAGEQPIWSKQASGDIESLRFSNDGQYIAARVKDIGLVFYAATNGDSVGFIGGGSGYAFFLPGNEFLLAAQSNGIAKYRVGTWEFVSMLEQDGKNVLVATLSNDGLYAAAVYGAGTESGIRIWDIATGKILRSQALFAGQNLQELNYYQLAFTCDNSRLLVSYAKKYNPPPYKEAAYITALDAQSLDSVQNYGRYSPIYNLDYFKLSPNCSMMVYHHPFSNDKGLEVVDYPSMKSKITLPLGGRALHIDGVDFTKDEKTMVLGGYIEGGKSGVYILNVQTGNYLPYFADDTDFRRIALSTDERYIVGGVSNYIFLFNFKLPTSLIHDGDISKIILYPNPATQQVVVSLEGALDWTLRLNDINGSSLVSVSSQDYKGDGVSAVLKLEGITPGAYLLQLHSKAFTRSYKLIIGE